MARRLLIPAVCLLGPALWLALAAEPEQAFHGHAPSPMRAGADSGSELAASLPAAEPMARNLAPTASTPAVQGPRVRFTDRRFDWGEVPANQSFGHVFTLHNDGDAVLHIQKLRPS
jgi:hypothetical protein